MYAFVLVPPPRRDTVPSVSLNIHEQDMKAINEDVNAHHLLQQNLYSSRKNVSLSDKKKKKTYAKFSIPYASTFTFLSAAPPQVQPERLHHQPE